MRQRGRKSANLLAFPVIEAQRPPLDPPQGLTKSERRLFVEIAASAEHLRPSDAPLLASYVQATLASRRSARDPSKADLWEKSVRLQAMLGTKLRLTPQSRTDAKTVGRHQYQGPPPWI
jgi:hypothetical protein